MKITITLFLSLLLAKLSFSQSIERKLIGTAGNTFAAAGYELSFSVGEVAIIGLPASSLRPQDLTHFMQFATIGFQQPNVAKTGGYLLRSWVSAYPNPATSFIRLDIHGFEKQVNLVRIFDMNGRQVLSSSYVFQTGSAEINISTLPIGYYVVSVTEEISHNTVSTKILKVK